jgi:hypothetical protein
MKAFFKTLSMFSDRINQTELCEAFEITVKTACEWKKNKNKELSPNE